MINVAVLSPLQRLYREKGENMKHNYTLSGELPELVQAKLNAMNLSEVKTAFSRTHTSIEQTVESSRQLPLCEVYRVELSLYICCVNFRAVTRNLGIRYVMVVTSCVWMPFPSSLPRHLQRSSVM